MPDLLLELFSEEIPARMQAKAADDLRRMVTDKLVAEGLVATSHAPNHTLAALHVRPAWSRLRVFHLRHAFLREPGLPGGRHGVGSAAPGGAGRRGSPAGLAPPGGGCSTAAAWRRHSRYTATSPAGAGPGPGAGPALPGARHRAATRRGRRVRPGFPAPRPARAGLPSRRPAVFRSRGPAVFRPRGPAVFRPRGGTVPLHHESAAHRQRSSPRH